MPTNSVPPTTRSRQVPLRKLRGLGRLFTHEGGVTQSSQGTQDFVGRQTTVSEGHPYHFKWEGEDRGGAFYTTRTFLGPDPNSKSWGEVRRVDVRDPDRGFGYYRYQGEVLPVTSLALQGALSQLTDPASSDADLIVAGTTAISRCKPGQPVVDLAVGLAELVREGIPSMVGHTLWQDRAKKLGPPPPKSAGEEYLNWVFGWAPLIADIKDTFNGLTRWDDLCTQYERDSGRLVRRSYHFPKETETFTIYDADVGHKIEGIGGVGPSAGAYKDPPGFGYGGLTITEKVTRERWFSGAFTYYLPSDWYSRNKLRSTVAKSRVLLGLDITPEVIWNLLPWSWAADWFANTGDLLSNVSDFSSDDLLLHYGYMMETSTVIRTYSARHHYFNGLQDPYTVSIGRQTKKRIRATPYGFGLNWDDFSPRQLAIIAALGITRR